MRNRWFESVAEAQRRSDKFLPWPVRDAIRAGAERGLTRSANETAFDLLGFVPTLADKPHERFLETSVLGVDLSFPLVMSPTGVQAIHPDGEVAVARASAAQGVPIALSSFGSKSMEEVSAANPNFFIQMYWIEDRKWMAERIERAKSAGAKALILTLDWSFAHSRDSGSPPLPERVDWQTICRFLGPSISRPSWLWRYVRKGQLPDLTTPNMLSEAEIRNGDPSPTFFESYGRWMRTPPPSWSDIAWVAAQWGGPCMVKGVARVDDARRAQDAGFSAISVSNHGGNNLDGTPSSIRLLEGIAQAVAEHTEVIVDGGIRRGGDVVKCLALGAKAAMIGRPYLWGLAINGEAGVSNVLQIMKEGIESTMLGCGVTSVKDVPRSCILVPPDFSLAL